MQKKPANSGDAHRCLVVKGKGGIGNRMLALAKILSQCGSDTPRILVEWNDHYYSDSPDRNVFPDVFDLQHPARVKSRRSIDLTAYDQRKVVPVCWKGHLGEEVYANVDARHKWKRNDEYYGQPASLACPDEVPQGGVGVYCKLSGPLHSGSVRWYRAKQTLNRYVSLNRAWSERIDEAMERLELRHPVTGVHVRFASPKKRQDVLKLWRKLDKVATGDIFLATDSRSVQNQFKQRYGNRLKVFDKWFSDLADDSNVEANSLHRRLNEQKDIRAERVFHEAIRDLFILARCEVLLCQPNSSFSQIAEFYSDANKIIYCGQGLKFRVMIPLMWLTRRFQSLR